MKTKFVCRHLVVSFWLAASAWAGTFGRVVTLGGHASDLALDEARGVLYVANFTASRIDVLSTADLQLRSSMQVAPQPGSVTLSFDGRYLLATHFANYRPPQTPLYGLTLIDLVTGGRQAFTLSSPALGAAFARHGRALVVTTTEFLLFDPVTGAFQTLGTVEEVTANTLPAPPADFPPQIVAASLAASGDRRQIYGLTDTIRFRYDSLQGRVLSLGYTATPPMGPRVVSVSRDGSYYLAGWGLFEDRGTLLAQFRAPSGLLSVGSHAIDSDRGLVYAEIPASASSEPVLLVADADNLTVRERLRLPEHLAGKSVLSADGMTMYSISASGITVLPVGTYLAQPRLVFSAEELLFRGDFCRRDAAAQELWIEDPSGGGTDFVLSSTDPAIRVTPSHGVTPARIEVRADGALLQGRTGAVEAFLEAQSGAAVNLPAPLRVLVNLREPDQKGTVLHVPGKLVDVLADPARNRFFVLRQDRNQVLVYDGTTMEQIAVLRTGNTPTQLAVTFDRHRLLVGNDNSQIANVYNLATLQAETPIRFPPGHYPRSLAASGRALLASCRVAGPENKIDRVDLLRRTASELPSLGVWENKIDENTVLVPSPNGSSILVAQADGNVLLYDAGADTFTVSRKDFEELNGTYAASNLGRFVAGNYLLNGALVPVRPLETTAAHSSGFAFIDDYGLLTAIPPTPGPGTIRRVSLVTAENPGAVRMAEPAPAPDPAMPLRRTLAALLDRNAVISLTTSGLTVLPWNFDAAAAPPKIDAVVNAADFTQPLAPGGLFTVFGQQLASAAVAGQGTPLPATLGDTCLTVNGMPAPLVFVSPGQVNAQLPYEAEGHATLVLHTAGGVSDSVSLNVLPGAPGVFRSGVAGPLLNVPTVVRASNNQLVTAANPVHRGDTIVIYLTGLGHTTPAVPTGAAAPYSPLAWTRTPAQVSLGDVSLPVAYSGLTPGLVGVYQINAQVPHWTPSGLEVPLKITQAGRSTSIALRVVE